MFIILGVVITVLMMVSIASRATSKELSLQPVPSFAGLAEPQQRFVELCTGLTLTSQTAPVAVSYCLGNVRGFADSHTLTVRLASAMNQQVADGLVLWCIDRSISDKQLLDSVVAWFASNAERVRELTSEYKDTPSARTAVLIAALHGSFPCQR